MNLKPAKAPNDYAWQAIDIYLFSNGQEHSPPRKYHLKAEDLNFWGSTLNYLARSHYGSLHKCIELYSLTGTKIEGPLDLQDGMTYVAVVPPDAFIDSGYKKYLIKASRSWDKRQAKKTSAENNNVFNEKRQDTPEISLDNVYIKSTELTTINNSDDKIPMKSVSLKPRQIKAKLNKFDVQRPRRIITTSTPGSDKKRLSTQHTAFLKTPNAIGNSRNNSNLKTKENLYRKTFTKRPVNIRLPVNQLSLKMQRITKSLTKSASQEMIITPRLQSTTLLQTPQPTTPLGDKKTTIPNINVLSVNRQEAYNIPATEKMVSCNILGVDKQIQTQINTSNKSLSFIDGKIKVMPATIHKNSSIISCNIPIDENCAALINMSDVVNMSLQIELKHGETTYEHHSKHTDVQRTSSLLDLLKLRKSQSCNAEATITQTKSLESIITRINNNCANIIMRCGSCGKNTAIPRVDAIPVYKDDNGFFILMPNQAKSQNRRCVCSENNDPIHTTERLDAEWFTRNSCHPNTDTVYPCVIENVGIVMTILDSTSPQSDKYQSDELEIARTALCVNQDTCNVENCTLHELPLHELELTEYNTSKNKVHDLPSSVIETYSQTEWGRVWLEVRRQKDGRYSFHLPSLSVLREYTR